MSEEYTTKELLASEVKRLEERMDGRTEQVLTAFDMLKDRIDDIDRRQNTGITLLTLAITFGALQIGAIQIWIATRG